MQTKHSLKFRKLTNKRQAIKILSSRLIEELSTKKRVLWIITGGSNIPIAVETMRLIPDDLQQYLAIMLSDERFGPCGHKDSNLQQLHEAGFIPGESTVVPVLTPDDLTLEAATVRYQEAINAALTNANSIIGQLGIGSDGHIAGILPNSPAVTSRKLVTGYHGEDFDRITITFSAIRKVTAVYAFVFDAGKLEALKNLRDKSLPLRVQPAQILKQLSESYLYNNLTGERP